MLMNGGLDLSSCRLYRIGPSPPCFATLPAICKMWPSTGSLFSVELLSWVRPSLCFGMTRKCTGACGLMSLQRHMATCAALLTRYCKGSHIPHLNASTVSSS